MTASSDDRIPADLGLAAVAEWAPHERCWMAWPCRESLWGKRTGAARSAIAELARTIARYEPVVVLANEAHVADASIRCGPGVEVLPIAIDDSWPRDTGPVFLAGKRGRAGAVFRFNGWGGIHIPYQDDAQLAQRMLERLSLAAYSVPLVLEGGALDGDGEGTILVTESCALDPNRNPGASREIVEEGLRHYLGAGAVIWLEGGLEHDETGGHADNVARFVAPGRVAALDPGAPGEPNHDPLAANLAILLTTKDAQLRGLEIVTVPQPAPRRLDGRLLCQSYLNFCIANGAVIVPVFDDGADGEALRILAACFPGRRVEPFAAADIVFGGGGIHCATLNEPAKLDET
ncbi:MAG TPA: agmatine deiminase family protein [Alphaproteobacteria bacterium]|nr:agmatine deiminase family protein [Alphaproteobacteria bacterium]